MTDVVILAGGLGTRLRSVIADLPKPLAPVGGQPFIARLLTQVAEAGFRRVIICTGYRGNLVSRSIGYRYEGLEIEYSWEPSPRGTGGALQLALPLISSENALVMNGDSYVDADLSEFKQWHALQQAACSMVLAQTPDPSRFGSVVVSSTGRVTQFTEKGSGTGSSWINAGIYLVNHKLLEALPTQLPLSLERDVMPHWIAQGLYGFRSGGRFLDIGTPESFESAEQFFTEIPELSYAAPTFQN